MCHFSGDEETKLNGYAELYMHLTEYSVMSLIEQRCV
jgi:hypothetical protein